MKNNGKVDASSGDDMVTQIMVSAYPLIFHPRILDGDLRTAIIGFGSGVTVGATMQFPLGSVHVVELEPAVVESSRTFEKHNFLHYGVEGWPYALMDGLTVISNDGRNFLVSGADQYDVVVSEPSNPWITGVSNLFTEDHYRAAVRSLEPDGVYCQWIQLYEMSLPNIKTLFKTFATVFPYVVVFAADPLSSDTIMLGSFEPMVFDLDRVRALWKDPRVHQALTIAGVSSEQELIGRIIFASRAEVLEWTSDATVNTDDNALIEFSAPRDLIGFEKHERSASEIYREDWTFGSLDGLLDGYGEGLEAATNYAELALALATSGRYTLAGRMMRKSAELGQTEVGEMAVLVLANLMSDENDPEVTFAPPVPGPSMDPETERTFWETYERTTDLLVAGEVEKSWEALETIPDILRRNSGPGMRFLEAYLLYYNGEYSDAIDILLEIIEEPGDFERTTPEVYYYLAKAYDRSYNYPSAVEHMRNFILMKLAKRLQEKARAAEEVTQGQDEGGLTPNGGQEEGEEEGQGQAEGQAQGEEEAQAQGEEEAQAQGQEEAEAEAQEEAEAQG